MEKGRISSAQLTTLLIGFIIGESFVLPPGRAAGHDAWIAILLGLGEALLLGLAYAALANRFRGRTFIEACDIVYGRYLGKVVAIAYIWYLIHLGSGVISAFSDFWASMIMPRTPAVMTAFALCLVCASAARNGIEVIARCSQVLVPVMVLVAVVDTLFLMGKIDLRNLQPVLEVATGRLLWSAQGSAAFPFGESVAFLMVFPYISKIREASHAATKGLLIAGLILTITIARSIAVLGATTAIHTYPGYHAVRQIDVAMVFTRLEILVAVNLLHMGFLKVSVLIYGAALGSAQMLRLRSYRYQTVAVAMLMAGLSRFNFANIIERLEFDAIAYPFYASLFQVAIPLLTLLVANIRRLPQEGS